MPGLLYKNFRINRSSFVFSLITAGLCGITAVLLAVFMGGGDSIKDSSGAGSVSLVFGLLYYLAFMLPAMTTSMLFEADENKTCCAFAMSVPQGGKGHVESKYWYILTDNLVVLFVLFISDTAASCIFGGKVSSSLTLVLLFCWRLLLNAVEIPFIIRFGSQKGIAIKGAVVGLIFLAAGIYFLFGDISWLINADDPAAAFIEWLSGGDVIFWAGLFPFFSAAAYRVSCIISVKLFRKGAENYEQ